MSTLPQYNGDAGNQPPSQQQQQQQQQTTAANDPQKPVSRYRLRSQKNFLQAILSISLGLRIVDWMFTLIIWTVGCTPNARIVQGTGFMVFVAVSAFVLDSIYVVGYIVRCGAAIRPTPRKVLAVLEILTAMIWTVMMFAAAVNIIANVDNSPYRRGAANTMAAFGILSSCVWAVCTVLLIIEYARLFRAPTNIPPVPSSTNPQAPSTTTTTTTGNTTTAAA